MRYVGSKNRLSKHLAPIIQAYVNEADGYLEPFVGGANMIDKIKHNNKIGYDVHYELIALLKYAQNLDNKFPYEITEDEYKKVREFKYNFNPWYVGLVGFCASFGSKYFGGYARGYKADKVTPRNHSNESIKNLENQRKNLVGIDFRCDTFENIEVENYKNYVIYCDPPYKGTLKYKTNEFDYECFYQFCEKMSKNNVVLISEYNMPEDRFECIWSKDHFVGINHGITKKRTEKLYVVRGGYKI